MNEWTRQKFATRRKHLDVAAVERALASHESKIMAATLADRMSLGALCDPSHPNSGEYVQALMRLPADQREAMLPETKERARQHYVNYVREQKREAVACKGCALPFGYFIRTTHDGPKLTDTPDRCLKCDDKEWEDGLMKERLKAFHKTNPLARYYIGRRGQPPRPDEYKAVLEWNDYKSHWENEDDWEEESPGGLVLHGDSFTGKTTALYHLAERIVRDGDDVLIVNSEHLAAIPSMAATRGSALADFMNDLKSVQVLGIDDLDKARITPTVAVALWGLIESRLRGNGDYPGPVLITTNVRTKQEFIKLFAGSKEEDSKTIGLSIYNRLVQSCAWIDFDAKLKTRKESTP